MKRLARSILIDDRGTPICSAHGRTVEATGDMRPGGAALYRCTECHATRWVGV